MRRLLLEALAVLIVLNGPMVLLGQENHAATGPMTKETFTLLRSAVIAATPNEDKIREENLAALDRLAKAPWRRVTGLPWVHVFLKDVKQGHFTGAWKIAEDDRAFTLMATDLKEIKLAKDQFDRIEAADFQADLGSVIRSFRERNPEDKRKWDFTSIQDLGSRGYPYYPGVFLLRLAYAAADCGFREEADAIVAEALRQTSKALTNFYDELVWQVFRPAMFRLRDGGPRAEFLATCKGLLASYPGSRYDEQLRSLISPLEREAIAPRPSFLDKEPADRTREETIRSWVYELRDLAGYQWSDPGYPDLFSRRGGQSPTAADRLVAIGPPAIPALIEALEDDTPTRTLAWQRRFYPVHFVLRRQDVAMKCLERIVGCRFYEEGATSIHFHMDKPERRASALANVRAWRSRSRDASQAQMIRNQLALQHTNITLSPNHRISALEMLAILEGPEGVVEELHQMLAEDANGLNSPVRWALDRIDPQEPVREAFRRFREGRSRDGDYVYLYEYGDRATYREIARRFEATGRLDPGDWTMGEQAHRAAWHGQNWAIPIVAGVLQKTEMIGARSFSNGPSLPFSNADEAIEEFQQLTGKDFGYKKEGGVQERLDAIVRSRRWWEEEGREALKDRIAEDHPPVTDPGDLFLSDAEIDRRVQVIEGEDGAIRREMIASLGKVYSFKVQRALLNTLGREADLETNLAILRVLHERPETWHLPGLTRVLEQDPDTPSRVLAGQMIRRVVSGDRTRLETRDKARDVARRLVQDERAPRDVRRVCADILKAADSFQDLPLLQAIAEDPAFHE